MSDHAATGPMTWVWDPEGIGQLIEAIYAAQEIVWDTETTGLVSYAVEGGRWNNGVGARQALATFTLPMADPEGLWDEVEPTTWILPLSHPDSPFRGRWRETARNLYRELKRMRKPLSGHNLKFDVRYNYFTTGIDLTELMDWDTQDGSRLLEQGQSAKLGDAAARAFGIPSWKDFDFSKIPGAAEGVPLFELGEYGGRDTYWTWRLKRYQQDRMFLLPGSDEPYDSEEVIAAKSGRLAVLVGMPTVASLTKIEQNGFYLDEEHTAKELAESTEIAVDALTDLAHHYEQDWLENPEINLNPAEVSTAPTSLWFGRFMKHAVDKGDAQIMNLTKTGKPQWSKSILNKQAIQRGPGSVPAIVLEQRKHAKRKEYLDSWIYHCTEHGKVHCNYSTGMSTGRLSSSGPNMQQVTKQLRPCFIPGPGKVIADFDFSQIELRVAAEILANFAKTPGRTMMEAFLRGDDLHRLLAADVMSVDPSEVLKDSIERQMAKAVNFGLLFGLGVFGLQGYAESSYGVAMTTDQAQEFYNAYFRKWEGLKEWHAEIESKLMRDNYTISPLGRQRFYTGGMESRNAAINAPVQGTASDLMQLAMADIQGFLGSRGRGKVRGATIVGTVHDSAVIELPEEGWEEIAYEVKDRMENLNPLLKYLGVEFEVPIVVEATIGTRWSLKDVGEIG